MADLLRSGGRIRCANRIGDDEFEQRRAFDAGNSATRQNAVGALSDNVFGACCFLRGGGVA